MVPLPPRREADAPEAPAIWRSFSRSIAAEDSLQQKQNKEGWLRQREKRCGSGKGRGGALKRRKDGVEARARVCASGAPAYSRGALRDSVPRLDSRGLEWMLHRRILLRQSGTSRRTRRHGAGTCGLLGEGRLSPPTSMDSRMPLARTVDRGAMFGPAQPRVVTRGNLAHSTTNKTSVLDLELAPHGCGREGRGPRAVQGRKKQRRASSSEEARARQLVRFSFLAGARHSPARQSIVLPFGNRSFI